MCVCVCVKESVCEEKRRGKRPTSSFFPDSVNTNSAVQRGLQECFGAFRECESNYDFCLCAESENRHAERSDTLSAERLRVPTIRPVRAQAALNSGCTWRAGRAWSEEVRGHGSDTDEASFKGFSAARGKFFMCFWQIWTFPGQIKQRFVFISSCKKCEIHKKYGH